MRYRVYTFLIMMAFWVVLSGKFDAFHLSLGVISSLIVSLLSADILFRNQDRQGRPAELGRFLVYIPWLIREIFVSTLQVSYLALHPKMMDRIDPTVVTFKTRLKKEISKVAFANSITLTPGTVTIRIVGDEFYVHTISRKMAEGLPGEMEERIAAVFEGEG